MFRRVLLSLCVFLQLTATHEPVDTRFSTKSYEFPDLSEFSFVPAKTLETSFDSPFQGDQRTSFAAAQRTDDGLFNKVKEFLNKVVDH